VVAGVTMLAGHLFNDAVRDGASVPGVGERLTRVPPLGSFREWEKLIAGTAGRVAYLGVASAGLALIGLVVAGRWALQLPRVERARDGATRDDAARFAAGVYTIVTVVGTTLLAAATFTGRGLPRIDQLYYGRYVEGIGMAVVVIGAAWVAANIDRLSRTTWGFVVVACGVTLVVMIGLARLYPNRPSVTRINISNIVAVVPLRELLDRREISTALLFGTVVVVVVLAFGFLRFWAWAVVMTIVLAAASYGVLDEYHLPGADARADQRVLAGTVHALDRAGVPTECVLWGDGVSEWHLRDYVFLLPESRFVREVSARAATCGPLAFVGTGPPSAQGNWHLVARENHFPASLWIDLDRMEPTAAQRVLVEGFAYDRPVCAVMPPAAYRSQITGEVEGVPATGLARGATLDVRVNHIDSGSPWMGSFASSPEGACGRISLSATVLDAKGAPLYDRRFPLPESLVPGQGVDVSGPLLRGDVPDAARLREADSVRLELTQDGVTDFVAQGDRATVLPLR
jgi:hypothetical protein